jgi:hypothetical protein
VVFSDSQMAENKSNDGRDHVNDFSLVSRIIGNHLGGIWAAATPFLRHCVSTKGDNRRPDSAASARDIKAVRRFVFQIGTGG